MKREKIHSGVWALAITSFAIGLAEFIVVGILPTIAHTFDISIVLAGKLVGIYAFALAIGTPVLVLLLSQFNRKHVLIGLIITFILGNGICIFAVNFPMLLLGRIVTAIAHGSFFAFGASMVMQLVVKQQTGRAIAIMFSGLTIAMVIGVPLGSLIGYLWHWSIPFFAVILFAVMGLVAVFKYIPALTTTNHFHFKMQLDALTHYPIWLMLLLTILSFGASFSAFTFITPILVNITGFSYTIASMLLIIFGIATFIGNTLGGTLTVKLGWQKTLFYFCIALLITLTCLSMLMSYQVLMVPLLFVWGIAAFGVSPTLQTGVLTMAERYSPKSIDFSSALNISAFNLGITLGETSGSYFVAKQQLSQTPLAGIAMICGAMMCLAMIKKYS
ncbi:MFS transporter [Acinetobacter qingfengensis]|nr:MFS transporter [Acinetobacter qingfengensis]KAA8734327.1 MFS transporter [Acinetobacter qingfengensis]